MPTKRTRLSRNRLDLFTAEQREFLKNGHCVFDPDPYGDPDWGLPFLHKDGSLLSPGHRHGVRFDEELAKHHWLQHRRELMDECEPGTRPWAWWYFEAPEPRRIVEWGYPACLYEHVPHQPLQLGAIYEAKADYLSRLGL